MISYLISTLRIGPAISSRVKGFKLNVIKVAGGTALAQALLVLAGPILTRIYHPTDFGTLAVYTSLLSMVVILGCLRYEYALPIPRDDAEAANLLAFCVVLLVAVCSLIAVGVWLLRFRIAGWMHNQEIRRYLWLLPLSIFGAGLYSAFNCWAIRKQAYTKIAQTRVSQSTGQILTQVGMGLAVPGPLGLFVGDAVGRASGTGTLAALVVRQERAALRSVTPRRMLAEARRFWKFPVFSGWSALLQAANLHMPALLIAIMYGPMVAGWLSMAQRVLYMPTQLISDSVAQVYFAESAQLMRTRPEGIPGLFRATIRRMFFVALCVAVCAALAGRYLFPVVFGKDWTMSGVYVQAIAVMSMAQLTTSSTGTVSMVLERNDLGVVRELIRLALLSSALFSAWHFKLDALNAILLFGFAGTVAYLFYGFISWYAIKAHFSRPAAPGAGPGPGPVQEDLP